MKEPRGDRLQRQQRRCQILALKVSGGERGVGRGAAPNSSRWYEEGRCHAAGKASIEPWWEQIASV